jgi:multidrug efflux pump subunit AcrA (membrane-fusion protein)
MASRTRRASIETTGLVVVRHTTGLTPQGKAADAAGWPTSAADEGPVEEHFEIMEGETRQSDIDSLRKQAARFALGRSEAAQEVADLLLHFADRVEQIDETVGELLARTGLDEGDRVEVRFPTVAEDRAKLAKALANGRVADRSLHTVDGPLPEALRARDGSLVDDPGAWPEERTAGGVQ